MLLGALQHQRVRHPVLSHVRAPDKVNQVSRFGQNRRRERSGMDKEKRSGGRQTGRQDVAVA